MPHRSLKPSDRLRAPLARALVAACAIVGVGCSAAPLRTREAPPDDGAGSVVPTDPTTALPRASDVARSSDTAATLRPPVPDEVALALVARVFGAFHARSAQQIEPDVDDYVVDVTPEGGSGGRPRASWIWELQNRLRTGAFDALDVDQMYRPSDVEIYGVEDLGLPGRPTRPASMGPDETLVRVPIATPRVGADVLFGDEILLLLRRDGARFKIRGYGERYPR